MAEHHAGIVLEIGAGSGEEACPRRWMERLENGETRATDIRRRLEARALESDKRWDGERDLRGLRLVDAQLAGLDLALVDLRGADLSGADLRGAVLFGARLSDAVLFKANLSKAELSSADMNGANLNGAQCHQAGFGATKLHNVSFFEADLSHATFTQADVFESDFRQSNLRNARLRDAKLFKTDFSRADLTGSDLGNSIVSESNFDGTNLRDAELAGIRGYDRASWLKSDVREVNWAGAYLVRRFIMDQNYLHEFRTQNAWSAWLYRLWWITSDCGRSLSRWAAWTLALAILFGWIYTLVDVSYGQHETWLSPFYYSVVTLSTLGYGDVLPASLPAQCVAITEVVFGYVALGGLITIFSNKLARRAD